MNPYDPLYARPIIIHLKKLIQKLKTEVAAVDPIILEMDELKRKNEQILKEITLIEEKWLIGCNKDDLVAQTLSEGIEAQNLLAEIEIAEAKEFPDKSKEKPK
jgi:hypothetical protein